MSYRRFGNLPTRFVETRVLFPEAAQPLLVGIAVEPGGMAPLPDEAWTEQSGGAEAVSPSDP